MPYEFLAKNGLISQGNITATGSLAVTQNISASATGSFGIVGIGTTNPATKFVVATSGTGQLRIGDLGFTSNYAGISLNAGSSYNLLSSPTDSTLYINRPSGGNINFRENNSDQIVLLSGGNVGIGSSSPSSKLEVLTSAVGLANQPNIIGNFRGDTDGRSLIRVDNTSTSAGAAALQSGVSFVAYSNTSNQPSANKHEAQIILGSTGATSVSGGQTGTLQIVAPLDIAFNVSASNTIMTGSSYTTFGSNAMYLARSGNVGIGTTTPVAIVDIQGTNITTYGGSNTGSLGTIYLSGNDAYNSGTAGSGIYFRGKFDAAGTTRTTFGAISAIKENNTDGAFDGALTFFARSGSNAGIIPERMRISSVGNVGIGTTSPSYKLDIVSGSMRVSSDANSGEIYFGNNNNDYLYLKRDNNYDLSLVQNASSGNGLYLAGAGNVYVSIDSNDNSTANAFIVQNNDVKTGTELFRVNEAGRVGVGTSLPTASIHVKPVSLGADLLILERYASQAKLIYAYESAADGYLEIRNGSDSAVSKLSGYSTTPTYFLSNVGIGTSTLNNRLHVYNSAGSSTTASNAIAVFEQNSNAGIQVCVPDASEAGLFFSRNGAAYYSAITRNGTDLLLKNGSATAVTINSSRNVGIGTTNPAFLLDVSGSSRFGFTSTNTHQFTGSVNINGNLTASNIRSTGTSTAAQLAEKVVTFTPLTGSLTENPAWYRLISGSGILDSGRVRLSANYDNSRSDIEFTYAVRNYDTDGAGTFINITRASTYNSLFNAIRVIEGTLTTPYAIDVLIGNYLNNTSPATVTCLYESQFISAVLDTPTYVSASATGSNSNVVKTVYTTYTSGYPRIGPAYSDGLAVATYQGQLSVGYRGNYSYNIPSSNNYALLVSGSVGIGTTTLGEKLTVSGNSYIIGSTGAVGTGLAYYLGDSSNRDISLTRAGTAALAIGRYYPSAWAETVRFTADGNVGIGTSSPNSKLEVAGTAGTGVVSILNTTLGRSGSFGIDGSGVFIRNSSDGDYFDLKNASGVARFRVIYDNATHLTTNFVSIGNLSATGSKLSVFGNLSVGSSYGSTAAPSNGAIFEGNVGVGTTSTTAKLHVYASGSSVNLLKGVTFNNSNASFNNASLEYYDTSTTDASTVTKVNYNAYFNKRGTANITGYTVGNFFGFTQIDSGSVNAVWDYASRIEVRNQATASSMYHFIADAGYVVAQGGVLGKATDRIGLYVRSQNQSSQTLTSQYGVYIEDLTSSINNYGIYSNISSAGNKYNIYAVGSADNYFAGNVGIGTTTTTSGLLSLHGTYPQLNINNPTTGSGVVIQLRDNGRSAGFMGHSTTTARLQFGSGDSTVTHMTIGESGDVGIGITSPTIQSNYRFLQVNGTNSAVIETMVGGTRIGGFDSTSNTLYVGSIGSFPVVFRTAVDEKMRIAAGGNVGIGTSSPIYKLDVNGDIRAMSGSTIRLQTSAGQERGTFQATDTTGAGGAGLAIATSGGEEIAFKDSADVNMVIKGTGRVGIGTITPAEMLHISSSNNTQLRLESGADAAVQFVGPDTHSYAIGMDDSDDKFKISYNASRTPPGLGTNDRLVITTAGNIGIGATSPSALLHVSDSTSEQVRVQSTGTPTRMRFVNNAGTTYNSYIGADTLGVANVGLIFQTGTSGATRMVVDVNGKVGIGTTIPTSSLDIIGDIKASSSTINILGNLDSLRGNVSTYGYNLTGSPSGTGWISVQTFHNALSSGDILSQLAYDNYNQQKLFTRYSADYGATWSSWKTIINSDALSGTINYIPKFTGTNSIGNSAIYDSGGNVGIATTAPGAPLDVVGQTGTAILRTTTAISTSYAGLRVYNNLNVGTRALEIDYAGSSYAGSLVTSGPTGESACVTTTGAYPLVLGTSNTARMTILGNGNVGIGSTSPAYKLDVAGGDVNFSSSTVLRFGTVAVLNTASSPNDIYANIRVLRNESTVNTDGMYIGYNSNGTTAAHLRFYANGTNERMRIDASNGNVGIGIANPAAKLSVTGSGTGQMLAGDAGFSGGNYTGISVNGTLNTTVYNILSSPTDTNLYINRPSGNTIYFRESNNDQMVLLTGGNLGIGTSNPSAKVQISGSANSVLLNVKSPISGNIVYVTGSGAVGINTTTPAYTLQVNGSFAATTKSFVIDHPTKPDKKLVYGSLESPYHGIRLTGRDTLVNGKCVVDLPDYISKLIMPETVNIQLTGIKCNKTLYVDDINIKENNFTVAYDKGVFESYKDYDFFWDFTAVRADVTELQTEM